MYVYNPDTWEIEAEGLRQSSGQLYITNFEATKGYIVTYLRKRKKKANWCESSDKIQHL